MGKKLLIAGADGQLGRALRQLFAEDETTELILTDVGEAVSEEKGIRPLDITSYDAVKALVEEEKPDVIVNAAAYTNVDGCEKNRDLAYAVNATGAGNLAVAARDTDAVLVHISTDYVFSGERRTRPYTELERTAPMSVYGASKQEAERYVSQVAPKYYMLRTAWLYGDGKNFVRTMLRLSETKDEISVVNDQLGSPTSALELARCIRFLLGTGRFGLYHATCEGSCSWAEFAAKIMELAGRKTKIIPVSTEEYKKLVPDQAERPAYSILENKRLKNTLDYYFQDWESALEEYLAGELK